MPAKYNLKSDEFGNFELIAAANKTLPDGRSEYRPGWSIDTVADLDALKADFYDCQRALVLLDGIDPATLAPAPVDSADADTPTT